MWRLTREEDVIIPHSNRIKPYLTEANKLNQLLYAVNEVERKLSGRWFFKAGYNDLYADEKWFFLSEENLRVYLAKGETPKQ